jgi:uncharacterized protein (TIGR02246 family)
MRWFTAALAGIAVAISGGNLGAQQPTRAEQEVLQVQAQRNKAMLAQDVKGLESIVADELTWCHSSARLQNKAEYLEMIRSGASQWLKLESHNMKARAYGDAAVVTGELQQTTTGPGRKPGDRTLHIIEVYVKRDGKWLLANFQATAVPEPATR